MVVIERMHRTLLGKARTMQLYTDLLPNLWDELYLTSSHLHAKIHLTANVTPFEKWHDRKPDYSYMREIGCKSFILFKKSSHNPKIFE